MKSYNSVNSLYAFKLHIKFTILYSKYYSVVRVIVKDKERRGEDLEGPPYLDVNSRGERSRARQVKKESAREARDA